MIYHQRQHQYHNLHYFLDLLVQIKIAPSKSEARRLVTGNGVSINSEKVTDVNLLITEDMFKEKFIVSKGKKTHIKVNLK